MIFFTVLLSTNSFYAQGCILLNFEKCVRIFTIFSLKYKRTFEHDCILVFSSTQEFVSKIWDFQKEERRKEEKFL